jgi:hypothetical protein
MGKCPKCGAELDARATSCARCGAALAQRGADPLPGPTAGAGPSRAGGACAGGLLGALLGFGVGYVGMMLWVPRNGTGGVFGGIVSSFVVYGGAVLGVVIGAVSAGRKQ